MNKFDNIDGDCFAACIASCLEVDTARLINPHDELWLVKWLDFLKGYGIGIQWSSKSWSLDGFWVASVPSLNFEGRTHAVVMKGYELAYDPTPGKKRDIVASEDIQVSYHLALSDITKLPRLNRLKGKTFETGAATK